MLGQLGDWRALGLANGRGCWGADFSEDALMDRRRHQGLAGRTRSRLDGAVGGRHRAANFHPVAIAATQELAERRTQQWLGPEQQQHGGDEYPHPQ